MGIINPFGQAYQVTEDDRDFLTLAANLGVSYDALKAANPNVQSLSQGQFINLPGLPSSPNPNTTFSYPQGAVNLGGAVPRPPNLTGSFLSGSGAPNTMTQPRPPAVPNAYLMSERGQTPIPPPVNLTGSFLPGGPNTPRSQAAVLVNTLIQGAPIPNMPISAAALQSLINDYNGDPAAIYTVLKETHQYDPTTHTYRPKNPSASGVAPADNTDFRLTDAYAYNKDKPFLEQYRYDPKTRTVMKIKDILRKYGTLEDPRDKRGKRRRNRSEEAPVAEEIRGEAPTTTLNLVLGG